MPDLHPLWLSLQVALGALALAFPLGVVAARLLVRWNGRWKAAIESVLLLPLVLPPVVTGLVLLLMFGRRGPLGQLFDAPILFSPLAAVLAGAVVAFPLVYTSARAAFEATPTEWELVARALGAPPRHAFWSITLPLAAPGLWAGAVLGFARALGEFGATVMIAGNVAGQTLTAPVAVYFAVENGELPAAAFYALALAALNLLFLALANARRTRHL